MQHILGMPVRIIPSLGPRERHALVQWTSFYGQETYEHGQNDVEAILSTARRTYEEMQSTFQARQTLLTWPEHRLTRIRQTYNCTDKYMAGV